MNTPAAPLPGTAIPGRRIYLTILSLLALSFMLFQIAVLRELRFQLSTIFTLTPFLFSGVLVCIGLGSLAAGRVRSTSLPVLGWSTALLPVLLLPLFGIVIVLAQGLIDHTTAAFSYALGAPAPGTGDAYLRSVILAFLAVAALGYGPVFFLQGVIFALYFREGRQEGLLSNVYAVDLIASGGGALLGGLLNFFLTPVQLVLLAVALLLVNLWISFRYLASPRAVVVTASAITLAFVAAELATGFLEQLEAPRWMGHPLAYSQWSRYRRIDVVDLPRELAVFADGLLFHEYRKQDVTHAREPRALPARLMAGADREIRDVLVLGSGTGSDVRILRHLIPRDLNIVAVELDGGFVETARAFPWLWNYYRTADIVVQEGRYFLENTPDEFDMVIYAYIDPQSAISNIGLPDANFMYTDAGLRRAYGKVRPGGYLVITRVFLVQEAEEFVRRLCATLAAAGVPPSEVRLHRTRGSLAWGYYGELSTIHAVVKKGGAPPVIPGAELVPIAWVDGGRPTTDFFPLSMVTGIWFDTLVQFVRRSIPALLLLGVLGAALVVRTATSLGHFNFFVLGFGSFLLESLVLFNSFLLLGDPNLSAAVAVGVFLLWNGVGSLWSGRFERSRWFYVAVPLAVGLYAATAPILNGQTIGLALPARTLAFSFHLALGGVVAGAMFPAALRSFRDERVSSMFFIDLVGCALGPVAFWLALSASGVWLVGFGAVLSYAIAALILARRNA
ncbi:MAG TPA: hypothetical protein VGW35_25045 [Methylomirabilota bacterium]|jgi:hypothetical protein|nr:hypothetical protein [Methylomirabilota bacterium]